MQLDPKAFLEKIHLQWGVSPSKGLNYRRQESNNQGLWSITLCISSWHSNEKMYLLGLISLIKNSWVDFKTFSIVVLMTSLLMFRSACNFPIMLFLPLLISSKNALSYTTISLSSYEERLSCFHLCPKLFTTLTS